MPLGEIIGEVILKPILEVVLYGITYCLGFVVLKLISFGSIKLAPLMTMGDKNRSKKKWYQIDWSIWIHRPMQGRALKAECTCLVGMVALIVIGIGIYFASQSQ